jgi:hypothetical protein
MAWAVACSLSCSVLSGDLEKAKTRESDSAGMADARPNDREAGVKESVRRVQVTGDNTARMDEAHRQCNPADSYRSVSVVHELR